jgi:C1A family cysteine protease
MKKGLAVLAVVPVLAMSFTAASAATLHPTGANFTPLGANVPHANVNVNPATLPTSYVISTGLPPVGDQGQQGSCVAWSTGYYQKSYGHGGLNPTSSSTQYSPSFIYNQLDGGVDGGLYPVDAYNLLVSKGDTTLNIMPYNQYDYYTQPNSTQLADAAKHKNVSSSNIFQGYGYGGATQRTTVKTQIYGNGSNSHTLVGIAIPVYPEWDNAQNNSTYVVDRPKSGESSRGGHMVTIIGYDDNKAYNGYTGAFKVINQWGTSWGNAGYTWISYDFFQNYVSEAWYMNTGTL